MRSEKQGGKERGREKKEEERQGDTLEYLKGVNIRARKELFSLDEGSL